MSFDPLNCSRVLVIDDDQYSQELLRRILLKSNPKQDEHESSSYFQLPYFEVNSAYQGQEGLALIEKSLREDRPYSLAFVDVRMPPGWDGIETIRKIWEKYDLQVVICTAYSDYSWGEMVRELGHLDRIVILLKPFVKIEVVQLAVSLATKWRIKQRDKLRMDDLEKLVRDLLSR
jgi:CheY-like chemotaxis protein